MDQPGFEPGTSPQPVAHSTVELQALSNILLVMFINIANNLDLWIN